MCACDVCVHVWCVYVCACVSMCGVCVCMCGVCVGPSPVEAFSIYMSSPTNDSACGYVSLITLAT